MDRCTVYAEMRLDGAVAVFKINTRDFQALVPETAVTTVVNCVELLIPRVLDKWPWIKAQLHMECELQVRYN